LGWAQFDKDALNSLAENLPWNLTHLNLAGMGKALTDAGIILMQNLIAILFRNTGYCEILSKFDRIGSV
jgi:hypothetical protein